jgi:hypothetical protein
MASSIRLALILMLLSTTAACRQAVKVVVQAQSGAALTQSEFRNADPVANKRDRRHVILKAAKDLRRPQRQTPRFAMTITVTPPCSQSTPAVVVARRG